ncbi:HlyD family type I secretion periplasmic adaptor subunit [Methylovirgula sp. 4M-Z18]|uniref:HlyD family type I secretion periplasmic adaptor subunit n=1 Tax=Methylovirgula sp. 4M-Z18 TaxID=2293567 RepID=UPI000E2E6F50|nr:HlyD family type I secretion periplasmic adaptor subunit [Methylovirgula sp. 4M-Z18]RFB77944.1 HlyD family type I secretion periplasmic adaptor subunit [Methylovirgula sp. 4M-Z18]
MTQQPNQPQRQDPAGRPPQGLSLVPAGGQGKGPKKPARPNLLVLHTPHQPDRDEGDREFLPAALAMIETPVSPARVAFIYVFCAMFTALLAWSYFGHIDVYATAPGKLQALGRTKVVQPLVSGQVQQIYFHDGDKVKEGDPLVQLDPTQALASEASIATSLADLRAQVQRRQAAMTAGRATPIDTQTQIQWTGDIPQAIKDREQKNLTAALTELSATLDNLQAQRTVKVSTRDKYAANIKVSQQQLDVITERTKMFETLWQKGWASRATYLDQQQTLLQTQSALTALEGSLADAEAAIPVLDAQIVQTREGFISTNVDALTTAQRQEDSTEQDLIKAQETVKNQTLRAPIDGTVEASAVTTVGQVVNTGAQLMQVVPTDAPLEIEAYILNTDAGFVRAGQNAIIKVDTFPYTRYGTISGKVVKVANDAIPGKQAQNQQNNPSLPPSASGDLSITTAAQNNQDLVFPVIIHPDRTSVSIDGKPVQLSSGLTVTVDIKTESRRALSYILSPVADVLATAAHER